jgi:flagellar biogenesis protein FliO
MLAASTVELALRMLVSLGFVAGLGWLATQVARTRLIGPGSRRAELRVCARQQVTRSATVAVLQAGDRHFLIGATDAGVTLLAEGDGLAPPLEGPADQPPGDESGPAVEPDGSDGVGDGVGDGVVPDSGILDVRAGDPEADADGGPKRDAGKRHGRAFGSVPAGMGVIEALRERTVRRS